MNAEVVTASSCSTSTFSIASTASCFRLLHGWANVNPVLGSSASFAEHLFALESNVSFLSTSPAFWALQSAEFESPLCLHWYYHHIPCFWTCSLYHLCHGHDPQRPVVFALLCWALAPGCLSGPTSSGRARTRSRTCSLKFRPTLNYREISCS